MRSIVCVSLFVGCWLAAIGAFRSSLLFRLLDVVPSQVRFVVGRLLCFLIVGIQASGHLPIWKEVKFIDRDPHWYTRRVEEAIHIRPHPNNINRDSGIEIPEAWIPTIRKHNSRPTTKRTCEGTTSNSRNNNEDRNAPIAANHHAANSDT